MSKEISKTQIDRLGDRIKRGHITEEDLRLLDRYRRTFTPAYEVVVGVIRDKLGLEPTGRPAKSTISIIDKLKREQQALQNLSDTTAKLEAGEKGITDELGTLPLDVDLPDDVQQELHAIREKLKQLRKKGYESLRRLVTESKLKEEENK